MRQELKDARGRLIATIEDRGDGRQVIIDARGRLLGEYDPANNSTTDGSGHYVGEGNLLGTLIGR